MTAPTSRPSMEQHPDILDMRARYERATANPTAQAVETLAILTGLYLAISPWVVGFEAFSPLAVSNLVTGIVYTALMAGFGSAYERTHHLGWAASLIGVWTIVSPWVIVGDFATTRTETNNVITGAVALLLGLAISSMAGMAQRRQKNR